MKVFFGVIGFSFLVLGCGAGTSDSKNPGPDSMGDDGPEGDNTPSIAQACDDSGKAANHEGADQIRWKYVHNIGVNAGPTIDKDGNLYLHGQHAHADQTEPTLVSLTPDGKLRWSADTHPKENYGPAATIPAPIIAGNEFWIPVTLDGAANTGEVKRFTVDGKELKAIPLPGRPYEFSAYKNGILYVPGTSLYAVDKDGPVWDEPFALRGKSRIGTNVVVAPDGTIYAGARGEDHSLYAVSPDGKKIWSQNMGQNVTDKLSVDRMSNMYVGMDYYRDNSGEHLGFMTSIDNEGYENWRFGEGEGPGQWDSIHIDAEGIIYAGGLAYAIGDEALYSLAAFKPAKGKPELLWAVAITNTTFNHPFTITAGGTLLLSDFCRTVYALDAKNKGELKWMWEVPAEDRGEFECARLSSPTVAKDGTIYVSAAGGELLSAPGTLYALKGDGTGMPCNADWPGNQGGFGMTGSVPTSAQGQQGDQ